MRNQALVRTLTLLRLLQQRGRWTLLELAGTFRVSTRTVRRDLAALEDAGYPIGHEHVQHGNNREHGLWWLA